MKALRTLLVIFYWVFFLPFYESFISIFHCVNGQHYLVQGLTCYQGAHIGYCVFAALGLFCLLTLNIIIALLYNET